MAEPTLLGALVPPNWRRRTCVQANRSGNPEEVDYFLEDRARDHSCQIGGAETVVESLEGLPMVLLAALAAGIPIVAARVGGVLEAVTECEAWLVFPESPVALAESIAAALRNREEARMRAARGKRRLVIEHSGGAWLSRDEKVYRAVTPALATSVS